MVSIEEAKWIMGDNFIGLKELSSQSVLDFKTDDIIPEIPFDAQELEGKKEDYLLILGMNKFSNGEPVTIKSLRVIFGMNPDKSEPCFYNQDWYDKEDFINREMESKWFLIRKTVYEDSRSVMPNELMDKYVFPTAIDCTYAFFVAWICKDLKLWYHDFVWCSDLDHNGDRIYVGKYNDIDVVNKNGFSVHRHLALRPCYGCVDNY